MVKMRGIKEKKEERERKRICIRRKGIYVIIVILEDLFQFILLFIYLALVEKSILLHSFFFLIPGKENMKKRKGEKVEHRRK